MSALGFSGASGGSDWGGVLQSGLGAIANVAMAKIQAKALRRASLGFAAGVPASPSPLMIPGLDQGGSIWDALGRVLAPAAGSLLAGDETPVATGPATACPTRKPGPPRLVGAVDNATGRSVFYRYVGRPILFAGDYTTLKTARKAVSRFGGAGVTGRTFRRRRRR